MSSGWAPATILGPIQTDLTGDYQLLAIKRFGRIRGARVRVGARMGRPLLGVDDPRRSSAIARDVSAMRDAFTPTTVAALTVAGGVLILGIGYRLLDLVPVALRISFRGWCSRR